MLDPALSPRQLDPPRVALGRLEPDPLIGLGKRPIDVVAAIAEQ